MVFVESKGFTRDLPDYMSDDEYAELQRCLVSNPQSGPVMPQCGGLRKLRVADQRRGKGKRGGLRIIYFHIPEIGRIYLLDIYDKDETDDLTRSQCRQLTALAAALRHEALRGTTRRG